MFPMGMVTQRMTQVRWVSKMFTTSSFFVVPPDVSLIWVDGCGGGSGGGGGDPTPGGGGGGGCFAYVVQMEPMEVTPGETLTLTVSAGGTGGTAGNNGNPGGQTRIVGKNTLYISDEAITGGYKGTSPNGGNSGKTGWTFAGVSGGSGAGTLGGGPVAPAVSAGLIVSPNYMNKHRYGGPGSGGALNYNGGSAQRVDGRQLNVSGGTGGPNGGGGGGGGCCLYGTGGAGGSNGAAGENATGYGAGGGGGSGNSSGGNGSPGFIRIYCQTSYTI